MDEITALAKRRGFIFQSSEIYGGIGGFYDYGPLGAILKRNVKNAWWRDTVELRDDVVGFDSSIIMHPLTWKASGHVDAFHDRMVDCKVCKHRFRADHLKSLDQCPDCESKNSLTEPRNFNLMMKTHVGPMEDTASEAYLRPETAQGIFVNFKNIYQTARKKPPFGIAQIGKSFRNEITPGNFTFRVREFEQAELEYFVPDDGNDMEVFKDWVERRKLWYSSYGIKPEKLRFYELTAEERPHYAKAGIDVEYLFPWGWGELESIAHRGTYDLDAHMQLSGKDLQYFDEAAKKKYTPLLIESSAGMDRTTLTFLIDAYENETSVDPNGKETQRVVLHFHAHISPIQVAVFSLARNKPELVQEARALEERLRPTYRTQYDEGNIGQLYRRQDEIGTPFCLTVDYDTLQDRAVTVRDRDSMRQDRIAIDSLPGFLGDKVG
ncbi:MAG TPA: glycine--tRNA ligase [Candidatus Baltobacteraceae bacterium]|nr:glycine--tRNA ligase [Candidatus Baltobacteraceae bacterium]